MGLGDGLDFWRDFTDVRDVAEAYRLLATADAAELSKTTYNIASGVSVFGRDLFRLLASTLNFSDYSLTDKDGSTSTEPRICGDASLLQKDTGWSTKKSLEQTVQDFISSL